MSRRFSFSICLALIFGLSASAPVRCDETKSYTSEPEHSEHSEHHPNLLAGFVGAALEDRRDSGLAVGIEYERRFHKAFGLGALAEHTFGDIDATVYAVPFAFHVGPWKLYAGPGIEDGEHGTEKLVRIGAEYGFEVKGWEISPQVDMDFVDGDQVFVLGVTFGRGF